MNPSDPSREAPLGFDEERNRLFATALRIEVLFFVITIVATLMTDSLTYWANLFRASIEFLACLLIWLSVRLATKGKSNRFNFGLGKAENFSSLITSTIMFVGACIIAWQALAQLGHPEALHKSADFGFYVMAVGFLTNIWLFREVWKLQRKGFSPAVNAQFLIYRNAVISNFIVLLPIAYGLYFRESNSARYMDSIGSLLLCGIIIQSGLSIFLGAVHDLMDQTLDEDMQVLIFRELADQFEYYEGLRGVRTRRSGSNIFIELHLEFAADIRMGQVQGYIERIKANLEESIDRSEVWVIPHRSRL